MKLEDETLDRLMAARISQQLMTKEAAMDVARKLFKTTSSEHITNPNEILTPLIPLVDDTKSWVKNDIFRLIARDFHGPKTCIGDTKKDKIKSFLLDHGAKAGCFTCVPSA